MKSSLKTTQSSVKEAQSSKLQEIPDIKYIQSRTRQIDTPYEFRDSSFATLNTKKANNTLSLYVGAVISPLVFLVAVIIGLNARRKRRLHTAEKWLVHSSFTNIFARFISKRQKSPMQFSLWQLRPFVQKKYI